MELWSRDRLRGFEYSSPVLLVLLVSCWREVVMEITAARFEHRRYLSVPRPRA